MSALQPPQAPPPGAYAAEAPPPAAAADRHWHAVPAAVAAAPLAAELESSGGSSASSASSSSGSSSSSDSSSSEDSEDGEEEEEEEDEGGALPYPGFAPIVFRYLDQRSRPRNWCLRVITNPYPFLCSLARASTGTGEPPAWPPSAPLRLLQLQEIRAPMNGYPGLCWQRRLGSLST
ncbi:hypothetical protein R5R35_012067 [Gryllus longicercus]|uniref:Voltage-dependent T-type calcium channel subunit alpha-1G n=1 Tax=Gryllus longicercus TaxID=2509291 RepID=A0AAN9VI36_9ORTH